MSKRWSKLSNLRQVSKEIYDLTDELLSSAWDDIENQIQQTNDINEIICIIQDYLQIERTVSGYGNIEQYILKYHINRAQYSKKIWSEIVIQTNSGNVYNGFFDYLQKLSHVYSKKISSKLKQINIECQQYDVTRLYYVFEKCVSSYCNDADNNQYTFLQLLHKSIRNDFLHVIQQSKADYYKDIVSITTLDNESTMEQLQSEQCTYNTYFIDDVSTIQCSALSDRQHRVLELLMHDYKQSEICDMLTVTKGTISKDVRRIRQVLIEHNINVADYINTITDDCNVYNELMGNIDIMSDAEKQATAQQAYRQSIIDKYRENKIYKSTMVQLLRDYDFSHQVKVYKVKKYDEKYQKYFQKIS